MQGQAAYPPTFTEQARIDVTVNGQTLRSVRCRYVCYFRRLFVMNYSLQEHVLVVSMAFAAGRTGSSEW